MIPAESRPTDDKVRFPLGDVLRSVLTLRSRVPEEAFSASILGTERDGSGVVIDKGLVLTIGYLVMEAEEVWLRTVDGRAVAGHPLAFDPITGFGLVQAMGALDAPALPLGSAAGLRVGDPLVLAAGGGVKGALMARLVQRQPFAGYWEYLLDDALFTSPAHPRWGGAGCIDADGRLVGIGSLMLQQAPAGDTSNMVVPIDLLPPVLDDLKRRGTNPEPPRPWLGIYAQDADAGVIVAGVVRDGPSDKAGVEPGDVIATVGDVPVGDLVDLWRQVWVLGPAGTKVPLTLLKGEGAGGRVVIQSIDRAEMLHRPRAN
ncbi:MAG: serine protease [Geminicoccaceae bacterium]|nr:serine protease [Geminicoccaceae bacterium]